MRFAILCNGTVIGHSDLEGVDLGMGILTGEFHPSPGYEEVRPIFQLFGEASPDTSQQAQKGVADLTKLSTYREAVRKLQFEIRHESGQALSLSNIHIVDFSSDFGPEIDYQVEVKILDAPHWLNFLPEAT
ncbi:hypothetical protein [Geothrix sp.]|uniref:hypothetical protein n=1 Tax=Geothrix sp. TaxID=1962974 RepID=UPI00262F0DC7|nr:hypothetical protein [Geothrix sp.]WIL19443.1 MAG: hypothetical protein QOZ81_001960 [Geothrix sp.]